MVLVAFSRQARVNLMTSILHDSFITNTNLQRNSESVMTVSHATHRFGVIFVVSLLPLVRKQHSFESFQFIRVLCNSCMKGWPTNDRLAQDIGPMLNVMRRSEHDCCRSNVVGHRYHVVQSTSVEVSLSVFFPIPRRRSCLHIK